MWEMYFTKGPMRFKFGVSDVLLILIRYTSIITIIVSNVGYFYQGFTAGACEKYYIIAPVWKVLQIMVSQMILGYRTYSISRRSPRVKWFLLGFGVVITPLEWFTNLRLRVPTQNPSNCTPGDDPKQLITWAFYLLAIFYDVVTLGMSTFFLWKSAPNKNNMTDLIRMMLLDGLGYWVVLTGTNILNLILYRATNNFIRSSAASFGYAVIWIMSQKLLIHVREASAKRSQAQVMVTHELSTAKDVVDAMRAQFGPKEPNRSLELDVQVQIERAVTVEYDHSYVDHRYRRELHSPPRLIWNSRSK